MAVVLDSLVELGYGIAYRVLNAQFFGVAQRRRRVFFVGHSSGQWERAAAVLFERASLCGDSETEREAGSAVAHCLAVHAAKGGDPTTDNYIPIDLRQTSRGDKLTNNRREGTSGGAPGVGVGRAGDPAFTVSGRGQAVASPIARSAGHHGHSSARGDGHDNLIAGTIGAAQARNRGLGNANEAASLIAAPLSAGGHPNGNAPRRRKEDDTNLVIAKAFNWQSGGSQSFVGGENEYTDALTRCQTPGVLVGAPPDADRVRTPAGIPGSLDVCPICEEGPDSPRYEGIGNAVAVPVVVWIFKRIEAQR